MKKLILILTLSLSFLSCSKDEAQVDDQSIIGNWIDVNGDKWLYLNLKSNGEFEYSVCSSRNEDNECLAKGKYTYNNYNLVLKAGYADFIFDVNFENDNKIQIIRSGGYGEIRNFIRK